LAQELVKIDNVTEVYSVGGRYDLAAVIRARSNEEISDIVTGSLLAMDGIISTETLIAFRVYSQYDLERLFSIGME
jgi:DNA-binding Lrp family transcriptional regulator